MAETPMIMRDSVVKLVQRNRDAGQRANAPGAATKGPVSMQSQCTRDPKFHVEVNCSVCGARLVRPRRQVEKHPVSLCSTTCSGEFQRAQIRDDWSRFMAKVLVVESGCWEWSAYRNPGGYGRFNVQGRMMLAHRFSYEHHYDPIPVGLELDHLCRNRCCVNPAHLEAVDRRTNTLRNESPSSRANRSNTCKRGHSYAEHSYYRHGKRICCRTCENEDQRKRRQA